MSQFGMQMPGGGRGRGSGPDIYTALMCVGTVCMVVAVALLWFAGTKVSPSGNPLQLQQAGANKIKLPK